MKQILLLGAALIVFLSPVVKALTVEEAYQAIPHRQTAFDKTDRALPVAQREQLSSLLNLAEQGMVLRVSALKRSITFSSYEKKITRVKQQLKKLAVFGGLNLARQDILSALETQQQYFTLREKPNVQKAQSQQLIQQGHHLLISAYNRLLQSYPKASAKNKQAFFDYLCALDFI